MTTPQDPFSQAFDSIEIDRARAPSPEAIERALSFFASQATTNAPGFHLIDDAGGRFSVDRETGVITLKDEHLLERERHSVHIAKLRVVEPSGSVYELELQLRLTGRVPQVVGMEDLLDAPTPSAPRIAWPRFAAVAGLYTPSPLRGEDAPFGAMLTTPMPSVDAGFAGLVLVDPIPAPTPKSAYWSL